MRKGDPLLVKGYLSGDVLEYGSQVRKRPQFSALFAPLSCHISLGWDLSPQGPRPFMEYKGCLF